MNQDRTTLKGFFTKGAIPSQENFADLIDSAMNQIDDGISKLPNDPLRINASGQGETVLNFYEKTTDSNPVWALSLNSGDASSKAGLNVSSSPGGSRLFIDYNSGNVGIGTTSPVAQLDVASGNFHLGAKGDPKQGAYLAWNTLTGGTGETDFINNQGEGSGGFAFMNTSGSGTPKTLMFITGDGKVGIGTTDPQGRLDVNGELFQHAPMIPCLGNNAWGDQNHPLHTYFKGKLAGQPPGTMLCVMTDLWASPPVYFIGCVSADNKAYLTVLAPGNISTSGCIAL
jgi:hypothetical protein